MRVSLTSTLLAGKAEVEPMVQFSNKSIPLEKLTIEWFLEFARQLKQRVIPVRGPAIALPFANSAKSLLTHLQRGSTLSELCPEVLEVSSVFFKAVCSIPPFPISPGMDFCDSDIWRCIIWYMTLIHVLFIGTNPIDSRIARSTGSRAKRY